MVKVLLDDLIEFSGNPDSELTLHETRKIAQLFRDALFYPKKSSLLPGVKEVSDEYEECYFIFTKDKMISIERKANSEVLKTTVRLMKDIKGFTIHQDLSETRSILRLNFEGNEEIMLDSGNDCNEHWSLRFKSCIDEISEKLMRD